jgi:hypothetical protein
VGSATVLRLARTGLLALVVFASAGSHAVTAATVYYYTGAFFSETFNFGTNYDETMRVTGSVVFAEPLPANFSSVENLIASANLLDYSFSDGLSTLTKANSGSDGSSISLSTDAFGRIIGWQLSLRTLVIFGEGHAPWGIAPRILSFSETTAIVVPGTFDAGEMFFLFGDPSFDFAIATSFGAALSRGSWDTPLPAALPLFATTLGVIGLLGWHRRRAAQP